MGKKSKASRAIVLETLGVNVGFGAIIDFLI